MSEIEDSAWGVVWTDGDWHWITQQMTTPEREVAADAVERHHALLFPGEYEVEGLRWWREKTPMSSYVVEKAFTPPTAANSLNIRLQILKTMRELGADEQKLAYYKGLLEAEGEGELTLALEIRRQAREIP